MNSKMFFQSCRRALSAAIVLLIAAALTGCGDSGPKRYAVDGTVTYEGELLPEGEIIFFPSEEGGTPDAGPIKDGKFSFRSLPGEKKVQITAARQHPTKTIPGPTPDVRMPAMEQYIPERYNTATELTANVDPLGELTYTFELEAN
ncbi:hypothetical protein [Blastopirellula marina]|uniref:Carboxypeptidase regulatory-like domain-containing protein n=1 Tax=Blastopirellula marina TaxID=124 RepID=A0A2S8GKA4_9BACT|nr:hypothetical protein [Blastopirellula marina]PQO44862.1 hypothetical protein C5Y93_17360 [Blastopirellula marina]